VDAAELASVRVDQPVEVTWSAVADHAWKGRTERLPKNITTRGERRVGEVICSIANDDQRLIPNLDVDVRIRVQAEPQALVVPRGAVRSDSEGRYVFVVRDGTLHRTAVELGAASPTAYAVVSGLHAGDIVALPTNLDVRAGMQVDGVPEGR
jgi:multidrug efflux pump subunit AcrA (membrane-fusion protein)